MRRKQQRIRIEREISPPAMRTIRRESQPSEAASAESRIPRSEFRFGRAGYGTGDRLVSRRTTGAGNPRRNRDGDAGGGGVGGEGVADLYLLGPWSVCTSAWNLVLQVSSGYSTVVLTSAPTAPDAASARLSQSTPPPPSSPSIAAGRRDPAPLSSPSARSAAASPLLLLLARSAGPSCK
jgi:hypothetical protein